MFPRGDGNDSPGQPYVDDDNMQINQMDEIPTCIATCLVDIQVVVSMLAREGPLTFQDEFIILYHSWYHKNNSKLQIGQVKIKGKQVIIKLGSNIYIKVIIPFGVLKLHKSIREALSHIVDDKGRENVKLRKRMVEMESSFSSLPLFPQPLSIVQLINFMTHNLNVDKSTNLLNIICEFVV